MILWTIRLAALCYAIALVRIIRKEPARFWWLLGCALYLAHVIAAFQISYHWSHEMAVRETTRQTEALFGLNWGGGVWFNYAFTAVWTLDAAWWLLSPTSRDQRPHWLNNAVHIYIAWMFVNGAIVFPQGPTRWIAAALALLLATLWFRGKLIAP